MNTLNLTSIPDNGLYRLEEEYFCDTYGRLWKNAGRKGERPLQLYRCEPGGEASGPIWADVEQVIVDGKGIFHYSAVKTTTIRFTHNIEPVNSYSLELAVKKLPDGDLKTVRISLSPTEALALECAISHSLHLLAFGVPSIFND